VRSYSQGKNVKEDPSPLFGRKVFFGGGRRTEQKKEKARREFQFPDGRWRKSRHPGGKGSERGCLEFTAQEKEGGGEPPQEGIVLVTSIVRGKRKCFPLKFKKRGGIRCAKSEKGKTEEKTRHMEKKWGERDQGNRCKRLVNREEKGILVEDDKRQQG